MKPLYELAAEHRAIWEEILEACDEGDGSIPPHLVQKLDTAQGSFEFKAEQCLRIIKDLANRALMNRRAAAELLRSASAGESHLERLKLYVKTQMESCGIEEFQGELFGARIQANPQRVDVYDESLVPESFFRTERVLEKDGIKAILSEGGEVPGARLARSTHLRIR